MKRKVSAKSIASYGCMTALALILSYVETLIPVSLGVPGAKLGLSNLVTLFALYGMGVAPACIISCMRIVLSGFLFGNLFAIFYSFAGFFLSVIGMTILKKSAILSMTGVSIAGGVLHNIGQLFVAAFLAGSAVYLYLPALLFTGTIAGALIGLLGGIILKRVIRYL